MSTESFLMNAEGYLRLRLEGSSIYFTEDEIIEAFGEPVEAAFAIVPSAASQETLNYIDSEDALLHYKAIVRICTARRSVFFNNEGVPGVRLPLSTSDPNRDAVTAFMADVRHIVQSFRHYMEELAQLTSPLIL